MKFSDWKILKEGFIPSNYLFGQADIAKRIIGNRVISVPDFSIFTRENEPIQQGNLFANSDASKTISVNYNVSTKKVHSIDTWEGTNPKPVITYYVKRGSIEELSVILSRILDGEKELPNMSYFSRSGIKIRNPKEIFESKTPELDPESPKPINPVDVSKTEISDDYDFSDPETVFEDLKTYIDMIIDGTQPSLLITGSPGVGKTYSVTKQLTDAGLVKGEDFIHVKGRSTAAGMFITLYENSKKIIVFDDCDSVFGNPDAVNILKGALDSYGEREISWLVGKPLKSADGKPVPKSFVFTGKIIFISNLPQRKIDDAIKSRSFVIEVALSPEDMLKKMRKELPNVHPEISLAVKEDAMDFIETVSRTAKHLELNMRTLVKTIKILKSVSNLKVAERLIMQQCSYK